MHFYLIYHHGDSHYVATHQDAKDYVKAQTSRESRLQVTVDLVEIDTSKENLLRVLNNDGGYQSGALRSWIGTPRGGLKEVAVGSL